MSGNPNLESLLASNFCSFFGNLALGGFNGFEANGSLDVIEFCSTGPIDIVGTLFVRNRSANLSIAEVESEFCDTFELGTDEIRGDGDLITTCN